jgi:hypothetical protein
VTLASVAFQVATSDAKGANFGDELVGKLGFFPVWGYDWGDDLFSELTDFELELVFFWREEGI